MKVYSLRVKIDRENLRLVAKYDSWMEFKKQLGQKKEVNKI